MENAPAMDPELLMAASHGQHRHLTRLIAREDQVAAPSSSERPTSVVVEIDGGAVTTSSPASIMLEGVTPDGDSALHVIAASGDVDRYLESAKVIHGKAGHLLATRNRGGRTPLHRAARAGNVEMLSLLIHLAAGDVGDGGEGGGGETRLETILRMTNGVGETALHEAIRVDDTRAVGVLMSADPCLARHHLVGAASPLFLAVALCRS
nr:unnamed protein product [Digitaria exilis]